MRLGQHEKISPQFQPAQTRRTPPGLSDCNENVKLTVSVEQDGDDKSIDTEDTSHDNGDDGLEEELWLQNDGGADADSRLGSAVGGTEVSEDEGGGDAHVSEECVLVAVVD